MDIFYVITSGDAGGAQAYVLSLAKHFSGSIVSGIESPELAQSAKASGVPFFSIPHLRRAVHPLHDLMALLELYQLFKQQRPKIVHTNSSKAGVLGSIAGKMVGAKVVFTAHGFVFHEASGFKRRLYVWIEKYSSLFRDRIIAVSDMDRNAALQYRVASEKKLLTIHNGIPPLQYMDRKQARAALALPPEGIVIGSIANYYHTKGLDVLIDAVKILQSSGADFTRLILIGEGPERMKLQRQIETLGLQHAVVLYGKRPNAAALLRALDLFVLPSRKEGLPFALLEAMHSGVPVIATDVGGNKEALGNTGLLVPPEDPSRLAAAITMLLRDSEHAKQLGVEAALRAETFSEQSMYKATEKVYQGLVTANQKTEPK